MMNEVQKNYMVAKAALQTYEEMVTDIEKKYIAENGIRNENGEIPARVYCIDDENTFNKANEETAKIIHKIGIREKVSDAREILKSAEEDVIKFALSIAPTGIRKTLERGARENYKIRTELINTTLKLDVSTL